MSAKEEKSIEKNDRPDEGQKVPPLFSSVSKAVKLDVVELLKQVLQWTPLYKPGLNKALLQAAKVGSVGCVKVLISAGADVETEDENGDTAFVHAFRGRHAAVMELLHEAGCTTEIAKMSLALSTKDKSFVKLCHSMDIPVENEDWNGADPAEVSLLMDELGLDPFEGQYGRHGFEDSPFMYLVQEGRPEIVEMLVSNHPCIGKYSEEDRRDKIDLALFKAVRSRRLDNVKMLLASLAARLEVRDVHGRTAFLLACGHDEATACYLLELGSDWSFVDNDGLTALHWAACSGYRQLVGLLLEKGIQVDARAKLGATALMVACSSRHTDIVELLLTSGHADPNLQTPEGWHALHVAVRACSPSIVRLLLAHGANPDVQSSVLTHNGDTVPASTPLLIAISLNSVKMIRHLMDANCDINLAGLVYAAANNTNESLLSSSESDEETRYWKQQHKAEQTCSPVQCAIISHAWDVAELLIRARCDLTSFRLWFEHYRAAQIPDERYAHINDLVVAATITPFKLRQITRTIVRTLLGRQLLTSVMQLQVPIGTQQFILFQDLFCAHAGSVTV